MNTRLQQFLLSQNITQAQFADSINVARGSVSHILAGRNKPSYEFIASLLSNYPTLNHEWLFFGKGKMYKDLQENRNTTLSSSYSESDSLFDQAYDSAQETDILHPEDSLNKSVDTPSSQVESPAVNLINTSNTIAQNIVSQRKVKKIFVLFDDGTYQEM